MVSPIWGEEFLRTYLSLGNSRSIMNEELHSLAMLSLIGQSLRNVKFHIGNSFQDCRIHPFIIQRSGSGKDGVFSLMKDVSKAANLRFISQSKLTEAAFTGTAGRGFQKDGIAKNADILAFKEASTIFNTVGSEHSSDLISMICMAIDVGGHVKKDLAMNSIEYNTHVSLFGTTYPPTTKSSYIETGFFPRLMFTYKPIDSVFYEKVVDWIFDNVGIKMCKDNEKIKSLGRTLEIIKDNTAEGYEFRFPYRKSYNTIRRTMSEVLSNYDARIKYMAEPLISRSAINAVKSSISFAAIDELSKDVKDKHINMASNIMRVSLTGVLEFISAYNVNYNDYSMIISKVIRDMKKENIEKTTVGDIMNKIPNVSKRGVIDGLDTLQELKVVNLKFSSKKGTIRRDVIIL